MDKRGTFLHAFEAEAFGLGLGIKTDAVIGDVENEIVVDLGEGDGDVFGLGVFDDVGEALLKDAIEGGFDILGKGDVGIGDGELEIPIVLVGGVFGFGFDGIDETKLIDKGWTQVFEGFAGFFEAAFDGGDGGLGHGFGFGRVEIEGDKNGLELNGETAEGVSEDVVQFAGEAGALTRDGELLDGLIGLFELLEGLGELGAVLPL